MVCCNGPPTPRAKHHAAAMPAAHRRHIVRQVNRVAKALTRAGGPRAIRALPKIAASAEVASGAKTDRAQLRRVLAQLDTGDVLIRSAMIGWTRVR
jgi:hypothetical protein